MGGLGFAAVPGVSGARTRTLAVRHVARRDMDQEGFCGLHGCVEEVRSELDLYARLRAGSDRPPPHPRAPRPRKQRAKLFVLAACSEKSFSYQRVKSEFYNVCQRHPEVGFLIIEAEKFPDIVRGQLHVRSIPTFILFRDGERIDHFDARDRKSMEQIIVDNA